MSDSVMPSDKYSTLAVAAGVDEGQHGDGGDGTLRVPRLNIEPESYQGSGDDHSQRQQGAKLVSFDSADDVLSAGCVGRRRTWGSAYQGGTGSSRGRSSACHFASDWRHGCINPDAVCQFAPQFSQFDGHIFDRLIAVLGIFRQTSPYNSLQVIRRVGPKVG